MTPRAVAALLNRLDERHRTLAEHLHTRLSTGATRYEPHEPTNWTTCRVRHHPATNPALSAVRLIGVSQEAYVSRSEGSA